MPLVVALAVSKHVYILFVEMPDAGIDQQIGKSSCIVGCVIERRYAGVREVADANHQPPLLRRAVSVLRSNRCGIMNTDSTRRNQRRWSGQLKRLQTFFLRFRTDQPRLIRGEFCRPRMAQLCFDKATVIPGIAQIAAKCSGSFQQLHGIAVCGPRRFAGQPFPSACTIRSLPAPHRPLSSANPTAVRHSAPVRTAMYLVSRQAPAYLGAFLVVDLAAEAESVVPRPACSSSFA